MFIHIIAQYLASMAILQWSYLSMGLRGASVFAGLCLVVFIGRQSYSRPVRIILYLLPILYLVAKYPG